MIERGADVRDEGFPIGFGDGKAGVGGFHGAADVSARAAGELAEQVHGELAGARAVVEAAASGEPAEARVRSHASQEVVGDRGNRVVAADALVERRP